MANFIDVTTVSQIDKTIRVFDSFYNTDLVIPTNEYDIVYGKFYETSKNKIIASNFTSFIFRIAQVTGVSALDLLDIINGKSKLEVNSVIAYYLNSFKTKTALYGISSPPRPNLPVQRNIVQ